ncbi:MAG: serine acetyltransferase [Firmicutes bacterium]|nr:serine acetyltransferase [Bacillota bacterium]
MKLNEWLNDEMPEVAKDLEKINKDYFFKEKTIGFAGKEIVYKIIYYLRSALIPGVYEKHPIDEARVNILIGNNIRNASVELSDLVEKAFRDKCENSNQDNCTECRDKASDITIELINKLPEIRKILNTDIEAAYNGDPAALSTEEILLSYPSIEAISIYRLAHELYEMKVPLIPRMMTEYAHQLTGIDIHPGAKIGKYCFIDHGTGVVIGETCNIGNNVKIYQGVTLGAKSLSFNDKGEPIKGIKRHPNIEDNVVIYSGATILGGDTTIGHGSIIGGNVWLTHSVPSYSKVYNSQPSPIIKNDKTK